MPPRSSWRVEYVGRKRKLPGDEERYVTEPEVTGPDFLRWKLKHPTKTVRFYSEKPEAYIDLPGFTVKAVSAKDVVLQKAEPTPKGSLTKRTRVAKDAGLTPSRSKKK